jgi:hypothetical protein
LVVTASCPRGLAEVFGSNPLAPAFRFCQRRVRAGKNGNNRIVRNSLFRNDKNDRSRERQRSTAYQSLSSFPENDLLTDGLTSALKKADSLITQHRLSSLLQIRSSLFSDSPSIGWKTSCICDTVNESSKRPSSFLLDSCGDFFVCSSGDLLDFWLPFCFGV